MSVSLRQAFLMRGQFTIHNMTCIGRWGTYHLVSGICHDMSCGYVWEIRQALIVLRDPATIICCYRQTARVYCGARQRKADRWTYQH